MNSFEIYLKKVADFHGHICVGIALGTRMSLAAMEALSLKPDEKHKNLVVYTEIDRCMTDAVQVVTGCSLGHRTLKYIDYGKFAASFINLDTGVALRVTVEKHYGNDIPIKDTLKLLAQIPDKELVTLKKVNIKIPETDLPGPPKKKAFCEICGERIMDGRAIFTDKKTLCRACAYGGYYQEYGK